MTIKVKLTGDQMLVLEVDAEELASRFRVALETGGVIEVHARGGRALAINPRHILYWEITARSSV